MLVFVYTVPGRSYELWFPVIVTYHTWYMMARGTRKDWVISASTS